ncbi:MAG: hypothetical protein DA405_05605 [Bacteroidetes bacterium]|nr:MAG: hypothetical protein DA405_05605 [Bacteroidota bacterium]
MTTVDKRQIFLNEGRITIEKKLIYFRKRIRLISSLRVLMALMAIFCFYEYLNLSQNWLWYLSLVFLAGFIFLVRFYFKFKDKFALELALQGEYEMEIKYLAGELPNLEHEAQIELENHPFAQDLNLFGRRSLFHHVNRSFSNEGKVLLQSDLSERQPLADVTERQNSLKELEIHPEYILKYRSLGRGMEEKGPKVNDLIAIWREEPLKRISLLLRIIMIVGQLFVAYALFQLIFQPSVETFKVLNYAVVFNLMVTFSQFKHLRKQQLLVSKLSDSMERYANLIAHLEQHPFRSKALTEQLNSLGTSFKASQSLRQLSAILNSLEQMANVFVLIFLNGFFHYHLHRLHSLAKWKEKYAAHLSQWLQVTANFELYSSYANYVQNHPDFHWPTQSEMQVLKAQNLAHPLIPATQRVANSFSFDDFRQMILTGSNMSGKSTFLRTVGLNLVLAKRGLTVAADDFTFYPFQVLCSMNPSDNIHENTSYFQAEVIRLKGLLDSINAERTSLLLLDEILRGTNSDDKKEGTRLFLKKIAQLNCIGIIATHDIDISNLSESAADIFAAYYFESTVSGGNLNFDYKLRQGVCLTPNATTLLRNYGII